MTCMITGHRKIAEETLEYVNNELRKEILLAIKEGYTHFISGFAEGVDLIFASIIVELKTKYPITLEAALPYRNRMNNSDIQFKRLIKACDIIGIHSEEYTKSCFIKRNKIMVEFSDRIIAVYDGRERGGTLFTMRYAHTFKKDIKVVNI